MLLSSLSLWLLLLSSPSLSLLLRGTQRSAGVFCRTQNAECRMMVSIIECETGRYIIYDKLISYIPNPNPNPNPKFRVRVRVRVRVRHVWYQFIIYDVLINWKGSKVLLPSRDWLVSIQNAYCRGNSHVFVLDSIRWTDQHGMNCTWLLRFNLTFFCP